MEAKQFAELLKSPLLVEQLPVDVLRDLVNRYPFSPSLQMLLLKHYQLSEHSAYDEQLAKAAISVPDRRALYRLVQLKPIVSEVRSTYERPETEIEQEEPVISIVEVAPIETNTWHLPIEPGVAPYNEIEEKEVDMYLDETQAIASEPESTSTSDAWSDYKGPIATENQEENYAEHPLEETIKSEEPAKESAEPGSWLLPMEPGIVPMEVGFGEDNETPIAIPETETDLPINFTAMATFDVSHLSHKATQDTPIVEVDGQETTDTASAENNEHQGNETIVENVEEKEGSVVYEGHEDIDPLEPEVQIHENVQEEAVHNEVVAGEGEKLVTSKVEEELVDDGPSVNNAEAVETEQDIVAPTWEAPKSEPTYQAQETRNAKLENSKASFNGWLQRLKHHDIPVSTTSEIPSVIHNSQPQNETTDEVSELDALFGAGTYEASLIKDSINMPNKPFTDPTVTLSKEQLMEPDEAANKRMDEQAKKSMSMGEELVTETLAKIYEIQKKNVKAIEAYEVLKQRHPHKADEYEKKIQKLREV